METSSFHFFRKQSTGGRGSSYFFNWNIFFSQSFILASGNEFFCLLETLLCCSEFILLLETIIEIREKTVFKDEPYSCKWTPIFWNFQRSFKVGAAFWCSRNIFFNKSFIRVAETDFLSSGNSTFWSELFSAFGNHYRGKQLSKRDSIILLVDIWLSG